MLLVVKDIVYCLVEIDVAFMAKVLDFHLFSLTSATLFDACTITSLWVVAWVHLLRDDSFFAIWAKV
jgi:hypothetical protein